MAEDTSVTMTRNGYRATEGPGGRLIVHDVPIFCACERDYEVFDEETGETRTETFVYDDEAIRRIVATAKQQESENYFPALHIVHHDQGDVRRAGQIRITKTGAITMWGQRRVAIFADLVFTDAAAKSDVLTNNVPYRSVEIRGDEIVSLSLLEHQEPYLKLPMLFITEVDGKPIDGDGATVSYETFGSDAMSEWHPDAGPVLGSWRTENRTALLFSEETHMGTATAKKTTTKKKGAATKKAAAKKKPATKSMGAADEEQEFEIIEEIDLTAEGADVKMGGDDGDDEDTEDMAEGSIDAAAVIKAIESGEIPVKDFEGILAAIQARNAGGPTEEEEAPAEAPVPTGDQMQNSDSTVQFAKLAGENVALKRRLDKMEADAQRKLDVDAAMDALRDRPLGDLDKFRDDLVAFHVEHGRKAFSAHVETIGAKLGPELRDQIHDMTATPAQSRVVMSYDQFGPDAVESAAAFSRNWKELHDSGHARLTEKQFVAVNMKAKGFDLDAEKAGDE